MTEEVEIKTIESGDAEEWRGLWSRYLAFYRTDLDERMVRTAFGRLLSGDPHEFCGLLARTGGRAVGLAHFLFHRHGWKRNPVCYLQDLWVEPDVRRRGVGEALIRAVYGAADAAGAPDVWWLTAEDNAAARRLYDRVGRLTPFLRYDRA